MSDERKTLPSDAVKECLAAVEDVVGVLGPNVVYRSDVIDALTHVLGRVAAREPKADQ